MNTDLFIKIIALVISGASLVVAITSLLLTRRISMKKTMKERQFETVCELIKDFSMTIISLSYEDHQGTGKRHLLYFPQLYSKQFAKKYARLLQINTLYVENFPQLYLEFIRHTNNTFLPTEIRTEMLKFWIRADTFIADADKGDIVPFVLFNDITHPPSVDYVVPLNPEFKTVTDLQAFVTRFIKTINAWLDKYHASDLKFDENMELD